jgi:hypothetical protein
MIRQRRAILYQQFTRALNRLHALLLDCFYGRFFYVRPSGRFGDSQRVILVCFMALSEWRNGQRGNDLRLMTMTPGNA